MNPVAETEKAPAKSKRRMAVVDCDVHPGPRELDELREYFDEPWKTFEFHGERPIETFTLVSQTPNGGIRLDAISPDGGKPGTDPVFSAKQLREMGDISYAILIPLVSARPRENPAREAASCTASNRWLADTWLGKENVDDIYRGSIRIAIDQPDLAVAEIETWAEHPGYVQICMAPGTLMPLGDPIFDPVHAAASRHGLPMSIHPLTAPGSRLLTPVGFPSYFDEYHSEAAMHAIAHLTSLVFNGTFEKFPGLRYAIVESGNAWLAPLLWKMDRHWHEFRSAYPELKRLPSDVVRERVRVATQPLENPETGDDLAWILDAVGTDEMFMFSSDYPHHDADEPDFVLSRVPKAAREKIMSTTALDFYGLPPRAEDEPA